MRVRSTGPLTSAHRQFRTAVVSWRSMAIAFALTVVVLWVAEARFIDPDTNWAQHLGSALLGCIGAAVWAAFGLVIAATTRWRHTGPRVERVVHLAVVVVTCAGSLYLLALSIRVAVTGE